MCPSSPPQLCTPFDQHLVDDDPAADAGAHREQHHAAIVAGRRRPRTRRRPPRWRRWRTSPACRTPCSPGRESASCASAAGCPARAACRAGMSIGPGVASPTRATAPASSPPRRRAPARASPMRRAASAGPRSSSVADRPVRHRPAGVVDDANLDVRPADVDADKQLAAEPPRRTEVESFQPSRIASARRRLHRKAPDRKSQQARKYTASPTASQFEAVRHI